MLDLIHILILSAIEGFTEFLPISSTAHLVLASTALGIEQTEFVKSFEIGIQAGAILAVVALYWRRFIEFKMIKRLFAAFVPTAFIGVLLYSTFKEILLGNELIATWSILIGGIVIVLFEVFHGEKSRASHDLSKIPLKKFFLIGLFQSVSLIPGVSRAAATILGGMLIGIKRKMIVEFSFLLAVPTMIGVTGYDLLQSTPLFSMEEIGMLTIGMVASFVAAMVAIKFFLRIVETKDLKPFGYYRIVLGIGLLLMAL